MGSLMERWFEVEVQLIEALRFVDKLACSDCVFNSCISAVRSRVRMNWALNKNFAHLGIKKKLDITACVLLR